MELTRREVLLRLGSGLVLMPFAAAACTSSDDTSSSTSTTTGSSSSGALAFNPGAWSYDATNDVYYRLDKTYVSKPAAQDYESLAVFVPGTYLAATENSDGTYTATIDPSGSVAGFTAATAPIVLPVNTPGYSAQKPPSSYSYDEISSYLDAGFVYVAPGMRGKDSQSDSYTGNAPWGVTDLKAAVRYLRYNTGAIPGDTERMFVFGHSGGGAQSSVMGSSGDSPLYTPYLESIGAAMTDGAGETISDAIAGVMAWCPITSLTHANAAYEWNMGQFASTGTRAAGTWTEAYSKDLADAFAGYVNGLGLESSDGTKLELSESADGRHLAGSYYDHMISVIEGSLDDFLAATTFPYTPSSSGGIGGAPSGAAPQSGGTPPAGGSAPSGDSTGSSSSESSTTYATIEEYIDHLNTSSTWVTYDASSKKATVSNLAGFVQSQKNASKDAGAFDGISRQQTENVVLGLGTDGLHFAPVSKSTIADNEDAYAELTDWTSDHAATEYESDFERTDGLDVDVLTRGHMYDPMFFLTEGDGYETSTVAPHWRIRTGIMQGDTASTVEINLALALENLGVDDVDFATIWGQGHTQAELTGDATTNFVAWVTQNASS